MPIPEPLQWDFMRNAYAAGTIIAIVGAVVGFFVVLRGLSFAAHVLSHIGFAGASGAVVLGVDPLFGLLAFTVGGGLAMGIMGERLRGRDVAIGIVLAFSLGLGAFFLSVYTRYANQAYSILFGTILGVSVGDVAVSLALGLIVLAAITFLFRPLMFASVDPEVAAARGVPVSLISALFMAVVAVAVAEAAQVVGVLLVFTLLVAPPATAGYLARRPVSVIGLSLVLALLETWVGITLAFYTKYPVSFYIASLGFTIYLAVRIASYLVVRIARDQPRRRSPSLSGCTGTRVNRLLLRAELWFAKFADLIAVIGSCFRL